MAGYPVTGALKNYASKQSRVTLVTEFSPIAGQNIRVMARRSLGVVLIVALLGWTVNQPVMGCEGQCSRAAVTVLAGASPAYQPEPSPTRHSCCPRERHTSAPPSSLPALQCHHGRSSSRDCCALRSDSAGEAAILRASVTGDVLLSSIPFLASAGRSLKRSVSLETESSPSSRVLSFTVLRL